jgi:hypothetical protein
MFGFKRNVVVINAICLIVRPSCEFISGLLIRRSGNEAQVVTAGHIISDYMSLSVSIKYGVDPRLTAVSQHP